MPPTFRETELRKSQAKTPAQIEQEEEAVAGCMGSRCRPVLNYDGQRVIRLGQALLAEEAPPNGYAINLSMADIASKHVRDDLFDYLQTVALRFGIRQPIIDIRIRGNR